MEEDEEDDEEDGDEDLHLEMEEIDTNSKNKVRRQFICNLWEEFEKFFDGVFGPEKFCHKFFP